MRIGLVLSGGMSKGAYQLGFLEALFEKIDYKDIKIISGASIGALNTYAVATKKIEKMKDIYKDVNCKGLFKILYNVYVKKIVKKSINNLIDPVNDEIYIPFYVNITKFPIFSPVYYRFSGTVTSSMRRFFGAVICYPILAGSPKFLYKHLCFDGGAADNIPLYPLLKHSNATEGIRNCKDYDLDLILILHFDAHYDYRADSYDENIAVIDLDCSYESSFEKRHYDFTTENVEKMFESGYRYGKTICEEIFTIKNDTIKKLKSVSDRIFLREHKARMKNMSFDRTISLMNKIGKFFRKEHKSLRIYKLRKKHLQRIEKDKKIKVGENLV